mmetsp:Transcript_65489/g.95943  ORF Transcript_65489/g.95943 Transcript_65489/m.95943 type:complete len:203 (-) Transcript_65489:317-925(-)
MSCSIIASIAEVCASAFIVSAAVPRFLAAMTITADACPRASSSTFFLIRLESPEPAVSIHSLSLRGANSQGAKIVILLRANPVRCPNSHGFNTLPSFFFPELKIFVGDFLPRTGSSIPWQWCTMLRISIRSCRALEPLPTKHKILRRTTSDNGSSCNCSASNAARYVRASGSVNPVASFTSATICFCFAIQSVYSSECLSRV